MLCICRIHLKLLVGIDADRMKGVSRE